MLSRILFVAALVGSASLASVGAAEPEPKPEVVRLAITPATEPVPALKYQLLPTFLDRRPGNAALDYARAALAYKPNEEFELNAVDWLKLPPVEFDRLAKEKNLGEEERRGSLELVKLGSRCEQCDFQLPIRDQMFMTILLPEAQEMRKLARLVAVAARLRLREGRFEEAVELLQTGYAMARHVGAEPTLVTGLVGVSIAGLMDQVHIDLIQRRDAPSLFWAATFQPTPLVDPRPGVEAEMFSLHLSFPELAELAEVDGVELTAEEWNLRFTRLVAKWFDLRNTFGDLKSEGVFPREPTTADKFREQILVRTRAAAMSDAMTELFRRNGLSQSRIARMSDAERAVYYSRLKYDELRDEFTRWMMLPYPEAALGLQRAEERLRQAKDNGEELMPIAELLLPAMASVAHTYARAERKQDVFRIVEALRLYAGKHDGTLPKSLGDVADVPLPKLDSVTGAPFDYVLDGTTARLTLPEEQRSKKTALVYEITVAK